MRLGALIPGVEFMLPLSETSMLRSYLDAGIGLNDAGVEDLKNIEGKTDYDLRTLESTSSLAIIRKDWSSTP